MKLEMRFGFVASYVCGGYFGMEKHTNFTPPASRARVTRVLMQRNRRALASNANLTRFSILFEIPTAVAPPATSLALRDRLRTDIHLCKRGPGTGQSGACWLCAVRGRRCWFYIPNLESRIPNLYCEAEAEA